MKKLFFTFSLVVLVTFNLLADDSTMTMVGPGCKYHSVYKTSGPYNIKILEVDLSNPRIKMKTVIARDVLGNGFEKTSTIAKRSAKPGQIVIGAVNGDFFGISEPTNPYTFLNGSTVDENEFMNGNTASRPEFGVVGKNKPLLENIKFSGSVKAETDSIKSILKLNGERAANQLIIYNRFIGANTKTNSDGTEVKLVPVSPFIINSPMKFVVTQKVAGAGSMAISGKEYILSGNGTAASFLNNNFTVGDTVQVTLGTVQNRGAISSLIGGNERLVINGVKLTTTDLAVHPRTAVGFNRDSTKLFLITVDGRQPGFSVGMSYTELAEYMIRIGCYQGVNLDGGGSTTMVVRDAIVNKPSDAGGERTVGNSLLAMADYVTDEVINNLKLSPEQIFMDSTQSKKITCTGTDLFGYSFDISAKDITWEIHGIKGSIDTLGFFTPAETGNGYIIGRVNQFADTVIVKVTGIKIPTWSLTAAGGNLPSWLSPTASTERGIAYNYVNEQHRLYVVNRPNILILNAETGDQVGTISTAGVSGGTYPVNDIEVSKDGVIFAANLTSPNSATSPFKVYKWNSETSTAEVVIQYAEGAIRLGDKIFVSGSVSDNSAVVYAPVQSSNKILKWTMSNGNFSAAPSITTLAGITDVGSSPAVCEMGEGVTDFLINGKNITPRQYTSAGVFVAATPSAVVDSRSNAMRYFESGGHKFLAVYQYGAGNENAKVLDITDGLTSAKIHETTPTMGSNMNNIGTSGDVAFRKYKNGVYILYVLATNNGIGAYQINVPEDVVVPVEMTSFTAQKAGSKVCLTWKTATEKNNKGFEIERSVSDRNEWVKTGYKEGHGTTSEPVAYSFYDNVSGINSSSVKYRLKQVDYDGSFSYSAVAEVKLNPAVFSLEQNFPNPFNPETNIRYSLPVESTVNISVFNSLGQKVQDLVKGVQSAGYHDLAWNASSFTSGVYFYSMEAKPVAGGQSFKTVKKMMVIK